MIVATPLSRRWERAQHIDRSAIERSPSATQSGIRVLPKPSWSVINDQGRGALPALADLGFPPSLMTRPGPCAGSLS
jgi:hypothetical protein